MKRMLVVVGALLLGMLSGCGGGDESECRQIGADEIATEREQLPQFVVCPIAN